MGGLVESVERGVYCGVVGAEVEDAMDKGGNRAGNGVAAAAMGEDFAVDSVFLGVEGEGSVRGAGKVVQWVV